MFIETEFRIESNRNSYLIRCPYRVEIVPQIIQHLHQITTNFKFAQKSRLKLAGQPSQTKQNFHKIISTKSPNSITARDDEIGVCKPQYEIRIEQQPIKCRKSIHKPLWNWQLKKKQRIEAEFTRNLVSRSTKNWTSNGKILKIWEGNFEQVLRLQPNPEKAGTYTTSTPWWSWHTNADSCRCRRETRLEYTGSLGKWSCYQTPETKWGEGCFGVFQAYQTSPNMHIVTLQYGNKLKIESADFPLQCFLCSNLTKMGCHMAIWESHILQIYSLKWWYCVTITWVVILIRLF